MKALLPPGPQEPRLAQTLAWMLRPVEYLNWCRRRFGSVFTLRLAGQDFVFVADRDAIAQLFGARDTQVNAGQVNRLLKVIVGDHSVLLSDGVEHRRQRKLLAPAFQGERMRYYGDTIERITRQALQTWRRERPFALLPSMRHITLEVILRAVFGFDGGAAHAALYRELSTTLRRGQLPLTALWMIYLSDRPGREATQPWRSLLAPLKRADALIFDQIAVRRRQPSNTGASDILAMLLAARDEAGESMTDREIRDELMTALIAGHETTALSLAWALDCILSEPDVLARLREEIRQRAPGFAAASLFDARQVEQLDYLDATIREVLRLRPVLPVVGRVLLQPMRVAGYDLEPGTVLAPCVYLAHHDAAHYTQPELFSPDRFMGKSPEPDIWLPFGGGVRRCLGAAFAMYEMKIVLATVLSSVELTRERVGRTRIVRRAITLAPKGGVRVRLRAPVSS